MFILGISAYYHDSAAALLHNGNLIAAAGEERFTRIKHDEAFPKHAVQFCLEKGGISIDQVDFVVFYDKPFQKFERLLESYLAHAPHGLSSFIKAMPVWLKQKLWLQEVLKKELQFEGKILFPEHHQSHAASAFFASPFQEAAFLTTDGVGEWTTTSFGIGKGNKLQILSEIHFPHSLGLLYSAFTYYCGFRVNSGEYKLMGLAPYGEAKYTDLIRKNLIDIKNDGSFRLNMDFFDYTVGLKMTNQKFAHLFDGEARKPESELTQKEMDLAKSIQVVTEEVVLKMVTHIHQETGQKNLCLAGGVALNCVANGKILRESPFENLWIQPASGDAGGALGAALMAHYVHQNQPRNANNQTDFMLGSYLGSGFTNAEVESYLKAQNIAYKTANDAEMATKIATWAAEQKVIGLFRGQMEFGPRALGNRSIIADARGREMQKTVNLKIKFRESFRPFAPIVLAERVSDYFEMEGESPYMLLVAPVKNAHIQGNGFERLSQVESPIPAVTHVDGSARIQTVSMQSNPFLHQVLTAFNQKTGCGVLINTSFNVRGEPIVRTPQEAYTCFINTHIDVLVLENCYIEKSMLPHIQALNATEIAAKYGLD